jgi:predicted phage terminase large subunit-like protein
MTANHPEAERKLVEDKANGPAVISALRNKIPGLIAVEPVGDKVARAYAVTPICESRNVWLPHPQIAPWTLRLVQSLLHFPFGAEDDDVDAFTQLLRRFMAEINDRMAPGNNADNGAMSDAAKTANQRF